MSGPMLVDGKTAELTQKRPILDVHVSKRYFGRGNSPFLLEANFQVESGFTVFVGPSGAGKSTLLRCIAGLVDPDEGHITLDGKILFDSQQKINIAACQREVAFVFQSLALFPHLTVEENIGYGLRRLLSREKVERVQEILESFRIAHLKKNFPRELSGGERQRVAVARALVVHPTLLLLDEPLSSLDVVTKSGIIEDLKKWNKEHDVPILYVTHDQNELLALGEQIIVFDPNGEMGEGVGIASPEETEQLSQHKFHATVIDVLPEANLMTCRIAHGFDVNVPFRPVPVGAEVELAIDPSRILLAQNEPMLLNHASVVRGTISAGGADAKGTLTVLTLGDHELQIDSHEAIPARTPVWMLIAPAAVTSVLVKRLRPLQRVILFVDSFDAELSAMAEMICNAKIAERLRIPREALASSPVRATSAGLQASPGSRHNDRIAEVLRQKGMEAGNHKARTVTPELVINSSLILCMTQKQCEDLVRNHPYALGKTFRFSPESDLEIPDSNTGLQTLMKQMEKLVEVRITTAGI